MEGSKTIAGEKGTASERSFVMIKPDGVSRQLVGKVSVLKANQKHSLIARLSPDSRSEDTSSLRELRATSLVMTLAYGQSRDDADSSIKSLTPSPALAKEHYIDLASRPFYAGLVKYITSGTPVVAM